MDMLKKLREDGIISNLEFKLSMLIWKTVGIKLPVYRTLPLVYRFIVVFSFVFWGVSFIVIIVLSLYAGIESASKSLKLYEVVQYRFGNIVMFGSLFWLLETELSKKIYGTQIQDDTKLLAIDKKTNYFFIFLALLSFVIALMLFKYRFIVFLVTTLGVIVIYESAQELWLYHSVRKWQRIPLKEIYFDIIQEDVISNIQIGKIDKTTLYSLRAKYQYEINGKQYQGKRIFIDEHSDERLFRSRRLFIIKQWINDHKEIKYAYINPHNKSESILFKDISFVSIASKVFIIMATFFVIGITFYSFYGSTDDSLKLRTPNPRTDVQHRPE